MEETTTTVATTAATVVDNAEVVASVEALHGDVLLGLVLVVFLIAAIFVASWVHHA